MESKTIPRDPDLRVPPGREPSELFRMNGFVLSIPYVLPLGLVWTELNLVYHVLGIGLGISCWWLSVVDLGNRTIPDRTTAMVALIGCIQIFLFDAEGTISTLAVATGLLMVLWLASDAYWRQFGNEALGLGDVKLISAIALLVGPLNIWVTLFLACAGGIVATLMSRALRGYQGKEVPFGPFIAYAGFLIFLFARLP